MIVTVNVNMPRPGRLTTDQGEVKVLGRCRDELGALATIGVLALLWQPYFRS